MKIQAINNVHAYRSASVQNQLVNQPSFKGLVSPIENFTERDEECQGGEYTIYSWYNTNRLTYYRFTDDSPEELSALKKKYEYETYDGETSGSPHTATSDVFYKKGEVNVVDVPISYKQYKEYVNNGLSAREEKQVENALNKTNLQILLGRKEITMKEAIKQIVKEEAEEKKKALKQAAIRIINEHKSNNAKYKDASEFLK